MIDYVTQSKCVSYDKFDPDKWPLNTNDSTVLSWTYALLNDTAKH